MILASFMPAIGFTAYAVSDTKTGTLPYLIGHAVPLGISAAALILAVAGLALRARQAAHPLLLPLAYSTLTAALIASILQTGGESSAFLAAWLCEALFAAALGLPGLLASIAGAAALLIIPRLSPDFEPFATLPFLGTTLLMLLTSVVLFGRRGEGEDSGQRAYRKLATELSQVAGKAEVVINAIADGVIALDNRGTIQLINPAAQNLIGWGKQDAIGLNYRAVFKLTDKDGVELLPPADPISQTLTTNQLVSTDEPTLLTNTDKRLQVSIVVSPVGMPGSGVIVVFRDITKEKNEERAQAEFVSTASHEMRTPVASIEGYLGLVLNPAICQMDDKAKEFINKAHESAQHLGRLFQDLLDVSKADDGRLHSKPAVVDLVVFAHDIVQSLKPQAASKGLSIIFKPIPEDSTGPTLGGLGSFVSLGSRRLNPVLYCNVDNDHLREVLANLIENAIKYTPKGTVSIDVIGDSDKVTISIADSGIGIPTEDISHLFQKFYRVDNSATREIGGTGLGLYLCRRLVESMNGRIWVESEYQKGSTFFVELPRTAHDEAMRLIESNASEAAPTLVTMPPAYSTEQTLTPTPAVLSIPVEDAPAPPAVIPLPSLPTTPVANPLSHGNAPPLNTPLSTIEQNPQRYTVRRPAGRFDIPSR